MWRIRNTFISTGSVRTIHGLNNKNQGNNKRHYYEFVITVESANFIFKNMIRVHRINLLNIGDNQSGRIVGTIFIIEVKQKSEDKQNEHIKVWRGTKEGRWRRNDLEWFTWWNEIAEKRNTRTFYHLIPRGRNALKDIFNCIFIYLLNV